MPIDKVIEKYVNEVYREFVKFENELTDRGKYKMQVMVGTTLQLAERLGFVCNFDPARHEYVVKPIK